jgi:EmrB/QacA subfamily drug resistance transporter
MRNPTSEQIHARRWATLAVLCLSLLVVVVDNTIVNVAMPTFVRKLHASTASLQWVADAYTLAVAGLLMTLGSLGDRIGRHRTLAAGLVIFGAGSLLAGLSTSTGELIAFRVLMGIGAAAIMPSTLSILTNVFTDSTERAKAIAMWSAVAGLGVAIGPTLGGWLLEHFSWGSIFIVNLPIVAVALTGGRLAVPPSRSTRSDALDPVGAVLSIGGLVALVYAIIEAPAYGWTSVRTLGLAAAAVTILGAFVAFELRSTHPMVDLRIFRNPRFAAASFAITMIFLALFGWLFLFTQQLQFVLGYSTLQAGVRALPFAFTIGLISQPAARLAARIGTKAVVSTGLAVMAAGLAMMATSTASTGFVFLLVASIVIAAGMGLAMAPATESIMGALPPSQAGVGSAVNDTVRELGGALGVAVMGSVASSYFASRIQPALRHIPAPYASEAKASVGAAVTIGQHAPAPIGHQLIAAARSAFITGADHAQIVAVAAAVLGSLLALRFLPARADGEAAVTTAADVAVPGCADVAAAADVAADAAA